MRKINSLGLPTFCADTKKLKELAGLRRRRASLSTGFSTTSVDEGLDPPHPAPLRLSLGVLLRIRAVAAVVADRVAVG